MNEIEWKKTEIKWKKQAQQIIMAFGLPLNLPMETYVIPSDTNDTEYIMVVYSDNFEVSCSHYYPSENTEFEIKRDEHNFLICNNIDGEIRVKDTGDNPQLKKLLILAFGCLGFDYSFLEQDFNLNIPAHEKLEWQLEFQRRLREERSQVE